MTAVGKMCTPARQEFVLLSDTLGLSALVNGLHDKTAVEEGTHTSLLGPFYREASPTLAAGSQIAKNAKPGSECVLYGRVSDVNGKPLANATVSIWQTGADGLYDIQESASRSTIAACSPPMPMASISCARSSRSATRSRWTARSAQMVQAQARHGMRPAHIHFLVGLPGYRELVTALYLRDDPHLADDVVFGSSGDLAVDIDANDPDCPIKGLPSIRFDMRLSREGEADKTSGRVGVDPAAMMKGAAKTGNGQAPRRGTSETDPVKSETVLSATIGRRSERGQGTTKHWGGSMKRRTVLGGAVAAVAIGLSSGAIAQQPPIKIGMTMAQTGGLAGGGKASLLGIEIWRDAVNAKGGLLGRKVELVVYDDKSSAAETPAIYSKLIDVDKVDLLFAPYATVPTAPIMPLVKQRGMLLMGNFSFQVNSKVNHDMWFNNAPWGPADSWAASFLDLAQKAGGKTIAMLSADQEFAQNLARTTREVAKKLATCRSCSTRPTRRARSNSPASSAPSTPPSPTSSMSRPTRRIRPASCAPSTSSGSATTSRSSAAPWSACNSPP